MPGTLRVLGYPAYANAHLNPYNFLLYHELSSMGIRVEEFSRRALRKERWDILHIHWPHFFIDCRSRFKLWKSARKTLQLLDRAKTKGTKLVWTIHNAKPHEVHFQRMENTFWSELFGRLDGLIGLAHAGLDEALGLWPALRELPMFVIPHGHYRDVYPRPFGRQEARQRLGIKENAKVICWVGQIRQYKNVPILIESFRSLNDDSAVLSICGRPIDATIKERVQVAANGDPNVLLRLRFLPDFEIAWNLIAADVVVLPYASILNSGSALLALSFDRPVVVPALGAMPELQEVVGADWVRTYCGEFEESVLRQALDWVNEKPRKAAPLQAFDWPEIARKTADVYRQLA